MSAALKDSQVSVRLPNDLKDRMNAYAQLTGRTKSHVAMEALSSYLEWRIPQVNDLKAAVQAADQGEFASDQETAAVVKKYTRSKSAQASTKNGARRRAS